MRAALRDSELGGGDSSDALHTPDTCADQMNVMWLGRLIEEDPDDDDGPGTLRKIEAISRLRFVDALNVVWWQCGNVAAKRVMAWIGLDAMRVVQVSED